MLALTVKSSDCFQVVLVHQQHAFRPKEVNKKFGENNTITSHMSDSDFWLDPHWFVTIWSWRETKSSQRDHVSWSSVSWNLTNTVGHLTHLSWCPTDTMFLVDFIKRQRRIIVSYSKRGKHFFSARRWVFPPFKSWWFSFFHPEGTHWAAVCWNLTHQNASP